MNKDAGILRNESRAWTEVPADDNGDAMIAAMTEAGVDYVFFTSGSEIGFYQEAIAKALATLKVDSLVGTLDWGKGPVPNVAKTPLTGGQWRKGTGAFPLDLVIVSNSAARRRIGAPAALGLPYEREER